MKLNRAKKYPTVNGKPCVEVEVEDIRQVFDERDPAPFRQKDLDDDMVAYIILSLQEIGRDKVSKLIVFHSGPINPPLSKQTVSSAIQQFFSYERKQSRIKIKNILKIGFKSLLIGLCFLTLAMAASSLLKDDASFVTSFFKEGLLLLGWVSMWKPVNTFLYDWWPELEMMRIYEKLETIDIDIISKSNEKGTLT